VAANQLRLTLPTASQAALWAWFLARLKLLLVAAELVEAKLAVQPELLFQTCWVIVPGFALALRLSPSWVDARF
jgi:hypothetical protein